MNKDLHYFLKRGLHLESTHQIALSILLENIDFLESVSGLKITNPFVCLEPNNKKFDIGIKSSQADSKYLVLFEVKMWATTGKNQVEKQISFARKNDNAKLVYIIIGYPDDTISKKIEKQRKEKLNDFIYLDARSLIEKMKIIPDNTFAEIYANFLEQELFHNRDYSTNKSKAYYFSCHHALKKQLNEKILTGPLCSKEGNAGTSLRLYATKINEDNSNQKKKAHDKFQTYLFLKNDSLVVEVHTVQFDERKTEVFELKNYINNLKDCIKNGFEDGNIEIKACNISKLIRNKLVVEKKLYFDSEERLAESVKIFENFYKIIKDFNPTA